MGFNDLFERMMLYTGLSVPPSEDASALVDRRSPVAYERYYRKHIQQNIPTHQPVALGRVVEGDESDTRLEEWLSEGSFLRLLLCRGTTESRASQISRIAPICVHIGMTLAYDVRIVRVLLTLGDDVPTHYYLIFLIFLHVNSLATHLTFLALGGSMRMTYILSQANQVFSTSMQTYSKVHRRVFFAVQSVQALHLVAAALFYLVLRGQVDLQYNDLAVALWTIPAGLQKWYGAVFNAVSVYMFYQSAGSLIYFVYLMNRVISQGQLDMKSKRDLTNYSESFYQIAYIVKHMRDFVVPQLAAMAYLDMIVVIYGIYIADKFFALDKGKSVAVYLTFTWLVAATHLLLTLGVCARLNTMSDRVIHGNVIAKSVYAGLDMSGKMTVHELDRLTDSVRITVNGATVTATMVICVAVWILSYFLLVTTHSSHSSASAQRIGELREM